MKLEYLQKIFNIDEVLKDMPLTESEKSEIRRIVASRDERLAELEVMPKQLDELFEKHRPSFFVMNENEVQKTERIIQDYRSKTISALQSANQFRDRFLHILHAFELLFGMSEASYTRREMSARLSGAGKFIREQIRHLEQMSFDTHKKNFDFFSDRHTFGLNDSPYQELFYENRALKDRVKEFEKTIAKLNGVETHENEDIQPDF